MWQFHKKTSFYHLHCNNIHHMAYNSLFEYFQRSANLSNDIDLPLPRYVCRMSHILARYDVILIYGDAMC